MSMGIVSWWRKLTGRTEPEPVAHGRIRSSPAPKPEPGLSLADDPAPKKTGRAGSAGFDPYASDGGFAKPHSWERLDHQ
jgi:hypothetical protein